jgi:putative two-component system response regulator
MDKSIGHILIVDDESYIQDILRTTLENAGLTCAVAGDSDSALQALAAQRFDLVFTDILMPGKPGTELLQEIKKAYPEVIVVVITALDTADMAIQSLRLGAYDYIVKPFNLDQVLISANRALDKRHLEDANREHQKYLVQMADERYAETRRLFYSMTQVLTHLLDLKAPFIAGHAVRVAEMSRYVARELRMTEDGVRKVYLAALLHDVGMIIIEDVLLTKQEALTLDEKQQIKNRTSMAEEVLRPILDDEEVLKCIRHHRERYDGNGYPDGLKGNIIPLGARVIAVVEAFDAITSGRPYRLPRSPQKAMEELQRCTNTQFDPQVVTVFTDLYERIFRVTTTSLLGQL